MRKPLPLSVTPRDPSGVAGEPGPAQAAASWWRWGAVLSIVVGAAAAWLASQTPEPAPLDAPRSAFSAERAMADVRTIAAAPHPSGSPQARQVRDYLVSRLQTMGLSAQVQHAEGVLEAAKHKPGVVIAGMVDNVVGILPGRDRNAPALLIMSHYDTMPGSPGAGDDTIGVAASLEIARILRAENDRRRDVIFLFTDGEEPGLLGAQAFFSGHPLASRVGLVLNLEARGDAGRIIMFESSTRAGDLIRLLGAGSGGADANSLMTSLYRVMPNDTDLTVALGRGHAGLNFAVAGDQLAYHTSLATPGHLDRGSLQHMGEAVLPLALAASTAAALPARSPDLTYSDVPGLGLAAYAPGVGWGLIAGSAVLVGAAAALARRKGLAGVLEATRGAGVSLVASLAAILTLHLCGRMLGGEDSVRVYALLARYPLLLAGSAAIAFGAGWAVVAASVRGCRRLPFAAITVLIAAACSVRGLDLAGGALGAVTLVLGLLVLTRPIRIWALWTGTLLLGLVLALAFQLADPAGAFLVQWPLLLGALAAGAALVFGAGAFSRMSGVLAAAIAAVAFGQICYWASGFFLQIGPVAPEVLGLFVPVSLFVLAPGLHLLSQGRRAVAGPLAVLTFGAAALTLAGSVGSAVASPRQLTQVFFLADPQNRLFWRASAANRLDPWSRAALGGHPVATRRPLVSSGRIWLSPAPAAAIPAPDLSAEASPVGRDFAVRLRIRPGGGGRQLKILVQPISGLRDLTVNGRPLGALREAAGLSLDRLMVVYTAPPPQGVVIGFRARGHGRFRVTALETRDGWPPGAAPAASRPPPLLTWGLSDSTVVMGSLDYRW